jgi:hypothetical protein
MCPARGARGGNGCGHQKAADSSGNRPKLPSIAPECPQCCAASPAFGAAGLKTQPVGPGCVTLARTEHRANIVSFVRFRIPPGVLCTRRRQYKGAFFLCGHFDALFFFFWFVCFSQTMTCDGGGNIDPYGAEGPRCCSRSFGDTAACAGLAHAS